MVTAEQPGCMVLCPAHSASTCGKTAVATAYAGCTHEHIEYALVCDEHADQRRTETRVRYCRICREQGVRSVPVLIRVVDGVHP